jgi:hypothetical protein
MPYDRATHVRYFTGLDLGQAQEFIALAVLECTRTWETRDEAVHSYTREGIPGIMEINGGLIWNWVKRADPYSCKTSASGIQVCCRRQASSPWSSRLSVVPARCSRG